MMDHGIWQPDPEHASHTPPDFDNISCKPRLEPDLWHWAHSEVPEYPAISVWWWLPVASLFPRPAETNRLYPRGTHWGETMGARTCTLEESWGNPLWTTSLVCKVLLPRGSPFAWYCTFPVQQIQSAIWIFCWPCNKSKWMVLPPGFSLFTKSSNGYSGHIYLS